MSQYPRRLAISGAVASACLSIGLATAQTLAPDAAHQNVCTPDARGRMSDQCRLDTRAFEINGTQRLPETAERELPKATFVLGDPRAPNVQRQETVQTTPGAVTDRQAVRTPQFDSGEDLLKDSDRQRLDQIVAEVKGKPGLHFEIVGHTDAQRLSRERQKVFANNHTLGLARANQVGRYLTEQLGLPAAAYQAESQGPDQPVASPAQDPANWAANRRVEVRVYWRDVAAPVVTRTTAVTQSDPTECNALTDFGPDNEPLRITIDGQSLVGSDATSADRQRCVDVRLERNQLRLQYDNLSQPRRLAVAAWPVTVVPGDTVRFAGYSNYQHFTAKAELRILNANDVLQPRLLATLPLDADLRGEWKVPEGLLERFADSAGGRVYYRLRVYDAQGRYDETDNLTLSLADRHKPEVDAPNPEKELLRAYGESQLAVTNIPLRAGTVTASGVAIRADQKVRALGYTVPVDENGRFVFQQLVPRRVQTGEIAVLDADGSAHVYRRDFDLPKNDWFFVGQADLTLGRNNVSGPAALVSNEKNRYNGDTWSEGRLAGYGKGQLDERWTLTASVDTEERPLDEMFRNLDRKDPNALFRRFDPLESWATFGDDSTSIEDAPTQGRVYVRVDDGRSHAMWGNFKLNFGDTELARVSRGLYGLQGRYLGDEVTSFGDTRLKTDVYAAEPGTLSAREDFRGTGGSLYYLRNQDITRGAEKVFIEIRDRDSGFVLQRRQLVPSSDYEMNYLQGRIVLTSPLPSLSDDGSIVRAGGLTGLPVYLVVDYEYVPLTSSLHSLAVGGRAAWWMNDSVRLGVTASKQEQMGGDQRLGGVDVTVRKSETTFLKAEVAQTKGPGTGELTSIDGGFNFSGQPGIPAVGQSVAANAWRLEAQVDLRDYAVEMGGRIGAYSQQREAGFSAPGQLATNAMRQTGLSAAVPVGEGSDLKLKADRRDETLGYNTNVLEAQYGLKLNEQWKLGTGLRYDDKSMDSLVTSPSLPGTPTAIGARSDLAVQLDYTGGERWGAYGFVQKTLARNGTRLDNDRVGLGGRYRVSDKFSVNGEVSGGDGGGAGKAGVDYQYNDRSSVYTTYVLDTGRSDENVVGRGGNLITGLRSRIGDGLSMFTEHRHATGVQPGLTHAYGVQYAPDTRWTVGASFENGWIGAETVGQTRREAVALTAGYSTGQTKYSGGVEYRQDRSTLEDRRSWLLKNAWSHKADANTRWLGKFNWADSNSDTGQLAGARYTEFMLGYALRPVANDKLNLLFRYTYLYDLSSAGQVTNVAVDNSTNLLSSTGIDYQQRSHVFAVDATYDVNARWTVGGKYAWRRGDLRMGRDDSAPWFQSSAALAVLRADWKIVRNWDWMVEWRSLKAKEIGDRKSGWLTAGYYHINENFKVGVGYNFTDYSDNLTDLSYRSRGWFLNMLGKF